MNKHCAHGHTLHLFIPDHGQYSSPFFSICAFYKLHERIVSCMYKTFLNIDLNAVHFLNDASYKIDNIYIESSLLNYRHTI